ncbi:hypothetical protein D3C85_1681760 [compost metagenome]
MTGEAGRGNARGVQPISHDLQLLRLLAGPFLEPAGAGNSAIELALHGPGRLLRGAHFGRQTGDTVLGCLQLAAGV